MRIAIVTGASSGMGWDFALELARFPRVEEIWLIARRTDRLEALAKEIKEYGVSARVLSMDLLQPVFIDKLVNLLTYEKPEIQFLVNSSGFGRFELTMETPQTTLMEMIDLNVKVLTSMCLLCIPWMTQGSAIINIGSLSAFQPVPYMNVYAATKAYVLSLSRALNVELEPRGIRVMAVCPGWVKTEFFDHAVLDNGAVKYYNKIWPSEAVVRRAMADLQRGRDVSILGFGVRAQVLLTKYLPHRLIMRIWLKQQGHTRKKGQNGS